MSKTDKARQGKFVLGIRGRSAEITALRNIGWSWDMVASHFFEDTALGNASATRFSQEWSRQTSQGMPVDAQRAATITAELLAAGHIEEGRWVFTCTHPKNRKQAVIPSAEVPPPQSAEPRPTNARPSAPQEVQMVVPAVCDSDLSPIELSPDGITSMEKKLRTGIFKAADFADLLGFPANVCELAFMEARKEPRDLATVDRLVGRMVFSKLLQNEPGVHEYVGRLPGAAKWAKLKATGIVAFETAAKVAQQ